MSLCPPSGVPATFLLYRIFSPLSIPFFTFFKVFSVFSLGFFAARSPPCSSAFWGASVVYHLREGLSRKKLNFFEKIIRFYNKPVYIRGFYSKTAKRGAGGCYPPLQRAGWARAGGKKGKSTAQGGAFMCYPFCQRYPE